jgi:hypothetical protein
VKEVEVVEEEEYAKEVTLEEYLAQKKKTAFKKEARQAEALKKDNIEKVEGEKKKVETIATTIRNQDTYSIATGKNENAVLLGFQAQEDEFPDRERRGGRGGRGGRGTRGGPRTGGRGGNQGGERRRGGNQQLSVNEEAFPAL